MEGALRDRADILERILPAIFKTDSQPESLIKKICIHQAIAAAPQKIVAPKQIKINIAQVIEKYSPALDVVPERENNLVCPLTQGIVKKPWVGECGHVFEEDSIKDYIARGGQAYGRITYSHTPATPFCPIHGCDKPLVQAKGPKL